MLATKLLSAMAGGGETLYVDDVFSAYTYTGNGSTQTINNGIDLAGKGGLVWTKSRSAAYSNAVQDTARGRNNILFSNDIVANQAYSTSINSFNANGYTLGSETLTNQNGTTYVGWTFRKAAKFFDVVTYTGNGVANRSIAHSLGVVPGMVVIKCTTSIADWQVQHRYDNTKTLTLNTTSAASSGDGYFLAPTSTHFKVDSGYTAVNQGGVTYVAYLFAHDPGPDGIIRCGSYAGNSSATGPTVTLGWEPQYVVIKDSSTAANWYIMDSSRGMPVGSDERFLYANTSGAESGAGGISVTATGFYPESNNALNASGSTYIYLAIRRPNKPPTLGTQVYNAIARTGTGTAATVTGVGFAPDLDITQARTGTLSGNGFIDRLRGNTQMLSSSNTASEADFGSPNALSVTAFNMDGVSLGTDAQFARFNQSGSTYINHFFKRAPEVFDVVCWTAPNTSDATYTHNLGATPELIIFKSRSGANSWAVGHTFSTDFKRNFLETTAAATTYAYTAGAAFSAAPTTTTFSVSGGYQSTSATYVAYLFATKAGISKVGSYTGNATTNTINCGFTTGARFVLIKRTDSTGDWYVWDTVRGIIAGNDPYLLLNSTAAEVTSTDYIDPVSTGFELSSTAPAAINANGGSFIYLAFS